MSSSKNQYLVYGTSRIVGSIGEPAAFIFYTEAVSPREAYEKAREHLYGQGREHVHITKIKEAEVGGKVIEPDAYLGAD